MIFLHRPGEPIPPLGDHLGEFTSELKDGDHIVEVAAVGPKNYGYRTRDGNVECKVRGFTLNTRGQEQLNFDLLKQNVIDEVTEPEEDPIEIRVTIYTRSNGTRTPRHCRQSKKPSDTKPSWTNYVFDKPLS